MKIVKSESKEELGKKASVQGADLIRQAIEVRGSANIIVATGASQFEMLSEFIKENIDWKNVTAFHLDEYIGIDETHPASFRKYLKERFADKIDLKEFHYVDGNIDAEVECKRLDEIINRHPIDVAFVGIGENAHLAFNDPPADFETDKAYIEVELDHDCRQQQYGEGWFDSFEDVPKKAISMSVRQILKSKNIICSVPDARKAEAVKRTIESEVTPEVPSTAMQNHEAVWIFLDSESASLL